MESEEIIYPLRYREKGVKKLKSIKIDFVSNWINRKIDDMFQEVRDVNNKTKQIKLLNSEIIELKKDDPEREKKENEIKGIIESLSGIAIDKYINNQYELIQTILIDNEIKDADLLNNDFWDRCVDPATINDFLMKMRYKDLEKKNYQIAV